MRGIIRKKGKGRAIHVSAFLTDSIGVLRVDQEAADRLKLLRLKATETIISGVNNEGCWTAERLLSQLVVAITMFEVCLRAAVFVPLSATVFIRPCLIAGNSSGCGRNFPI